jgi:glycosyltransferase involved in cell wall biosynthesis
MASQFFAPVTGGEERLVEDLSVELANRGHDVSVATTSPGPGHVADAPQVRVHRIPTLLGRMGGLHADAARRHHPPFPDPEALVHLRRVIDTERPDVVHAHNWVVHSVVPALTGRRIPLVLTLHDYGLICANKRLRRWNMACSGPALAKCVPCSRHHYGNAKGVTTALALPPASRWIRRAVAIMLPVSETVARRSGLVGSGIPYEVIPNFVRAGVVGTRPVGRPVDLPRGPYLVFAGDITHDKGIGTLIEAYAGLADPPPLVLVGRELPGLELVFPPGVVMLGPRPHAHLMAIFRHATAAVVPSIWDEPFGLVALEAMAMGAPVVASRVGGLTDIVEDGRTGLLVPPGDAAALRESLAALLASSDLRNRLGGAGRERAGRFAASSVVPRVEAVYERLVGAATDARPAFRTGA